MFIEKRKCPRIEFNIPIKLSEDADYDIVTETKNISANGAYCAVSKNIPNMTKLKITLLVPSRNNNRKNIKRVHCEGVVVRNRYFRSDAKFPYHIGIFFSDIKDSDKKLIHSYINSVISEEPAA